MVPMTMALLRFLVLLKPMQRTAVWGRPMVATPTSTQKESRAPGVYTPVRSS